MAREWSWGAAREVGGEGVEGRTDAKRREKGRRRCRRAVERAARRRGHRHGRLWGPTGKGLGFLWWLVCEWDEARARLAARLAERIG